MNMSTNATSVIERELIILAKCYSAYPGLGSITQLVIKAATLRRTRTPNQRETTQSQAENPGEMGEHVASLLHYYTTVLKRKKSVVSFIDTSAASHRPAASLSHTDLAAPNPRIKRIDKD